MTSRRWNSHLHKIPLSLFVFSLALVALWLQSCASIQPPPGGPEEKTPPKIDTTIPGMRQVNVPTDSRIYFKFDRALGRASFMQGLSITPYVNGIIKYHWSGYDEVSVELPERLRDTTTYTVQLSRDLKSKRGNALATPISITFSTGARIDTGSLSGFLLTPINGATIKASDIYVYAYDISIRRADTMHLALNPPDLITQPNDQGVWQFLAMKTGHRYRVFAAGDVYRNRIYDPGVDQFGVPASDAFLDSAAKSNFYIRISSATDSIRPELADVEVIDSFHVRARFSEAIDSDDIKPQFFTLSDATIRAAYRDNPEHHPGQIILVTNSPITSNKSYTLTVAKDSMHDLAHNSLSDSASRNTFTSPLSLGKLTPVKLVGVGTTDSVSDVSLTNAIPFTFSDAVDKARIEAGMALLDTSKLPVPLTFLWTDDAHVTVRARDTLHSNIFYTLTFNKGSIASPVPAIPREAKDTTIKFRFRTLDAHNFGILNGDISIADSFFTLPASALVVQLLPQGSNNIRTIILPHGVKHYEFRQVQAGGYRVRAYLSRDGTANYDPGSVSPWRFGVPSGDFPGGAVTARARWEVRRINFEVR